MSKKFELETKFKPAGDQITAIKKLTNSVQKGVKKQVLLGATGTGKTFTIANVIKNVNRPTIVLSHNKTLAAQLYAEFRTLFPNNKVEYFISNFDYYRPEAYLPSSDTFIDKTSKSNWDIESMRMSALNAMSSRDDTIIIASVAAIYAQLSPEEYIKSFLPIKKGQKITRRDLIAKLVLIHYNRNDVDLVPGSFRVRGDVIEVSPSWTQDNYIRIELFGDEVENIAKIDTITGKSMRSLEFTLIYPAEAYTTKQETINYAIGTIKSELKDRLKYYKDNDKRLEYERLMQRTNSDMESLAEFGFCSGIENYSRHIDKREKGEKPFTIFDYIKSKDALLVIDESHMMIPQLNAMYNGDRSRKESLVKYGFRLPSALDNRPLKFEEFENNDLQTIYVSATPAEYELSQTDNKFVRQIIRPTGLLDPTIEIIPTANQIEDILNKLKEQSKKNERTFIVTTTKRMAEEISNHFKEKGMKIAYMHSGHKTFERDEILRKLRLGVYDAIVGVNLIREGIDIPEISLVCVLQADFNSFFRSTKSLIQIIGRAARNVNGNVIFYADSMTTSMQEAINETKHRRAIQMEHNKKHNIIPTTIKKAISQPIGGGEIHGAVELFLNKENKDIKERKKLIAQLRGQMLHASRDLDFERAAKLRDTIIELQID